jgi:hypothetical protein
VLLLPNENKMSDGGLGRASLGVEVWKSSQKWSVQRSAVRSIAWLGDSLTINSINDALPKKQPERECGIKPENHHTAVIRMWESEA